MTRWKSLTDHQTETSPTRAFLPNGWPGSGQIECTNLIGSRASVAESVCIAGTTWNSEACHRGTLPDSAAGVPRL